MNVMFFIEKTLLKKIAPEGTLIIVSIISK